MLLARFFQKPKVAAAVVYKPLTLEIFVEKTDECSFYQRAVSQGFLSLPAVFQVVCTNREHGRQTALQPVKVHYFVVVEFEYIKTKYLIKWKVEIQ